ncbi:MAG: FAD-dependent monooxygenase [Pseudomonadota bacterium]
MSQRDRELPIVISGAGIAGLTTALFLSRYGFQVRLFEKAEKLETVGAGIQISPNAFKVLAQLGLEEKLMDISAVPNHIHICNGKNGKSITSIPLGQTVVDRFGAPYCVTHRGDLQNLLLAACKASSDIEITYNSEIGGLEPNNGTELSIFIHQQDTVQAQGVVVADGVWSKLRTSYCKQDTPVFSGKVAWRAMIPAKDVLLPEFLQNTFLWLSPGSHIVTYPVRGGAYLNAIVIVGADLPASGDKEDFDGALIANVIQGLNGELSRQLKEVDGWTAWPIFTTSFPPSWGFERVALIGDAAHAMVPFAAQGAAMAIEDAAALAKYLSEHSVQEAMLAFHSERAHRLCKVARLAKQNGKIYHLPEPFAFIRNLGMKIIPSDKLLERQAWIYSWTPDQL